MSIPSSMSPNSLQEQAIRKIMEVRRAFLDSNDRHLVQALNILGCDTECLSLAELPWVLKNEILRREHNERFDGVLRELFMTRLCTDEWEKLESYDDPAGVYPVHCQAPSVLAEYSKKQSRIDWLGVVLDDEDFRLYIRYEFKYRNLPLKDIPWILQTAKRERVVLQEFDMIIYSTDEWEKLESYDDPAGVYPVHCLAPNQFASPARKT